MDLELDVASVVDVGGDLENDADVLVLEVLAQADGTGVLAGGQGGGAGRQVGNAVVLRRN